MFSTIVLSAQQNNTNQKPPEIPNLSEQQKTDIKKIREETKKKNQPLRTEIKSLRKKHNEIIKEEKADMNAINNNLEAISDKVLEIAKNRAQMHQDIRALLDADQRKWYDENVLVQKKKKGKKQDKKKNNK